MDCRPFAFVMMSLLAHMAPLGCVAMAADEPDNKQTATACLSGTHSTDELADRIAKFLSDTRRSDLDRLMSASECTAALAAGWERVRRTMPETEEKDVVSPDLLAITRFLGLVEGRLQVPVPKTWEEALKSAMGYGPKSIWFPRSDGVLVERFHEEWRLERDGAHWLLKKDNRLIKLPIEDHSGPIENASVVCAGEWWYVALYGSFSQYKLFAVDQGTGKVMWSSHVWGTTKVYPPGIIGFGSGSDWHVATLRLSGETLVVFGFSGCAVYVEAFDRKTGENRCRFSTAYFERVSPR
jgi:hypothetical protein